MPLLCVPAPGRRLRRGAHLVVCPEMALTGYPPEDLVFRRSFRAASWATLEQLATDLAEDGLGAVAVVVGYLDDADGPRNAAAFLLDGRVVATYHKHHLPNYGVFDEARYFVPGDRFVVVRYRGVDLALTICEDVWQDGGPFAVASHAGVGLVLNINGSPYERAKDDVRLPLLQRRAREAAASVVYVNTVGAQDELVFDGDSLAVNAQGTLLMRAPQYVEGLFYADLTLPTAAGAPPADPGDLPMTIERHDTGTAPVAPYDPQPATIADRIPDEAEVWGALVLGTRDYVRKNGFRSVVLGMSGGIDSAVVAAVAADAIGGDAVYGVSMPSSYSSEHSKSDAADLAERVGAHYRVVPVAPMVDRVRRGAQADRARRGERAGPGSRHHADGVVQRRGAPRADYWQQERVGGRATRRSTAMRSADSRRSRTCRSRWCGNWRAGATRRPSAAGQAAAHSPQLDFQAAVGRAAAGAAGQRLAARLRRTRRGARTVCRRRRRFRGHRG